MKATFGRITRPYLDLSGAFRSITLLCDKLLIYEHEPDEEVKKYHCHFVAEHNCSTKHLKNTIEKNLPPGMKLSGNGDWSMPENNWDKSHKTITYMTKGKLEPKYNQGYTEEEIQQAKDEWRDIPAKIKELSRVEKLYYEVLDDKANRLKLLDIQEEVGAPDSPMENWQFHKVKQFWWDKLDQDRFFKTPQFFKDLKTLTLTYCYAQGYDLPPRLDMWEKY